MHSTASLRAFPNVAFKTVPTDERYNLLEKMKFPERLTRVVVWEKINRTVHIVLLNYVYCLFIRYVKTLKRSLVSKDA